MEKIKHPARSGSIFPYYVSFKSALDLARRYQPLKEDKSGRVELNNPEKPFLDDLRWEVIEELGLRKEDEQDELLVYTTEGSELDYLHGADFVIQWGKKIITADLTLKKEKEAKSKKADIIIFGEMPSPKDKQKEDEYWKRVEDLGKRIAAKFIKKYYKEAA